MDKTSCYNTNMEADGKIRVIIVSPSLDPKLNVSGVSSVVNLIVKKILFILIGLKLSEELLELLEVYKSKINVFNCVQL